MLRKLLKYDFKEIGRLLFPILLGILVLSVVGRILFETRLFEALPEIIQVLSIVAYAVVILACFIGAPIYFIIFYYRGLYSNRGYITHTLPVSTHQKLLSKLITSCVLELVSFLVCGFSVLLLFIDKGTLANIRRGLADIGTHFKAATDMSFSLFVVLTILLMIVSLIAQLLMFYASVTLGQHLFRQHKIIGSIVGYLIINFAMQIIYSLVMISFGMTSTMTEFVPNANSIIAIYGISGCMCLLQAAVFYFLCYYLMEKKLNLS